MMLTRYGADQVGGVIGSEKRCARALDEGLGKRGADTLYTGSVEGNGREFLFVGIRVIIVLLGRGNAVGVLTKVLGRGEKDIYDLIEPRELARYENLVDAPDEARVLESFLDGHQADQRVDTDEADVPGVPRAANLSLEITGILPTHY